jgi:hypothetical protein
MAVLYITEFASQGQDARGWKMVVADQPPAAEQTVAIGASSVQSSAFNALTKFVRVSTDAVCSIEFGTNPTATAVNMRMAANTAEYFSVPIGASYKVAVIQNT